MDHRSRLIKLLQELFFWALRRRRRWRVAGTSMQPMFADGDLVLIEPVGVRRFRAEAPGEVMAGDVIVARHPFKNLDIIKFVATVHEDAHLTLHSPSGDDSMQFGRVPTSTVKGRVTANVTQRTVAALGWATTTRDATTQDATTQDLTTQDATTQEPGP